jgi:hypothetical protein
MRAVFGGARRGARLADGFAVRRAGFLAAAFFDPFLRDILADFFIDLDFDRFLVAARLAPFFAAFFLAIVIPIAM